MHEKIVLIGAGSASFTRGLIADIIRQGWACDLGLVDISPDALAVAEGLARKMIQAGHADITLSASTDRREIIKGATAVISTIGVGGRRAWEQDVFVPRKHGIFQPVGDSVMPGGTSRALRMIPAMVAIAQDVLDLAPEALFFNYANPMGPNCRAVRKATGANMIGLCHGVFHVGHYLEKVLGLSKNTLHYTAAGVNHLTWFVDMRHDGQDMMPRLRAQAGKRLGRTLNTDALGSAFAEAGTATSDALNTDDNPFTWQLLDLFGAFPAVLDRHVLEFFPHMFKGEGGYYGKTLGVDAFSLEQTIAWGDKGFDLMREIAESKEPLPDDFLESIGGEHEQVIEIIASLRRDDGRVFSANLPNRGQVPNLLVDAIVEAPAQAAGGTLKPLVQPPMAPGIAGTLATRLQWVETTVEAALEGSRAKFIQALILDGAVESVAHAAALADDLLQAQAEHLPQFNIPALAEA